MDILFGFLDVLLILLGALLFYSILILLPLVILASLFLLFCIASAPLAGLISALLAHSRGMSVWRYAVGGAVCSMLLFVPWLYLLKRIRGESVPYNEFVKRIYYWLYALWIGVILGPIAIFNIAAKGVTDALPTWLGGTGHYQLNESWMMFDGVIIPMIVGVPTLIISLMFLIRRFRAESKGTTHIEARELFQPAYFMPFVFAFATMVSISPFSYLTTFVKIIWLIIATVVLITSL